MAETTTAEVATRSLYDEETLGGIKSFQDALDVISSNGGVEEFSEYGSGFVLAEDKAALIKVPFVVVEWRFNESDIGDSGEFVSAEIVTEDGRKLIINDGSTGIYAQLKTVTTRREARGIIEPASRSHLMCRGGLRVSNYTYQDVNKKTGETVNKPASTYYLA